MKRIKRLIYRIFDRYLRKKAIKNHRKMWRWLAEHPGKGKNDYLMIHDPKADLRNDCYLCEYAKNKSIPYEIITSTYCGHCPLDWNGKSCNTNYSLYEDWALSRYVPEERPKLAKLIAELPERKDR